ncbi:MAG: helix-turn-helix transcriptional regulator [Flavobacteriales bacterium]|nr:helix-turn-helix transcriptional regulator [Flavobacteriales bacterium]
MQKTDFGGYIRELREKSNMPIRKLAHELDIDTSTLSKIERQERQVALHMIPIIARVFDLDYKELQVQFLSEKILSEYGDADYFTDALDTILKTVEAKQ